jgi:hypothetical protein
MNPEGQSESRATCSINDINLDLPHILIGNIIFRCSRGAAGNAMNEEPVENPPIEEPPQQDPPRSMFG